MRTPILYFLTFLCLRFSAEAQIFKESAVASPYKTNWVADGAWIAGGIGLNVVGFKLIQDKEALSLHEMQNLSKNDVLGIDRFIAGNYNERADKISYYPFYASFAVPIGMMLTNDLRPHAGQISVMFVETMATTGAMFTITAGLVHRPRPLAYNTTLPDDIRREASAQRAFFGGHTAATAAATFFAAKIYHDFYPESNVRPYVWTAAAVVPAYVGYLRSKAGKHFLTDNLVGYALGAATGILVPELHKIKDASLSITPAGGLDLKGNEFQGLSLFYNF